MNTFSEPAREIPISDRTNILVLGGGPAGFSAAVCAARQGASVVLVESSGELGGMATIGMMSHWTGNTAGGFYQQLLEKTCCESPDGAPDMDFKRIIDHEKLKLCMLAMAEEAGVKLKLYTMAVQPIVEKNAIKGVIIEGKSGREAILSGIVIDATGDGDIAARAGVPFIKGREGDGKMQPVTVMFKIGGVDTSKVRYVSSFEETYQTPAGDIQSLAKKHLPAPMGHILVYPSTQPNTVTINMTNMIDIDGTDTDQLTRGDVACRKQIPVIMDFLRRFADGFEHSYVVTTASFPGVRETRHFEGEETITEEDIRIARIFDSWAVTQAHFNFDVHNLDGSGLDQTGEQKHFTQNKGYTIPYGALVPKKIDNLYLCGRNISGTHLAHSNYRAMPICANIGQAAGTAAALCVKMGCTPRELPVKELQEALMKQGVIV